MKRILFACVVALSALNAPAQLLYKISGHGLTAPSYIVGTYHLASASFVDSIPGLRQAMADTQQTYGEVIMNDALHADSLAMMQQAMMLPEGMTIDSLLTDNEMQRLNAYMNDLLGMDMTNPMVAQQMNKLTPMALNTAFSLLSYVKKSGRMDLNAQFDSYFQKQALEQGKSIGGLETIGFQTKVLFGGKSLQRQKELLMCLVDNAAFMDEMTGNIVNAFYQQDIEAVRAALDRKLNNSCDSSPEEEATMIYHRNADWLTKMPAIMGQKPTLFAVGAAHLPGEKGVLTLLRQEGYTVEGVRR